MNRGKQEVKKVESEVSEAKDKATEMTQDLPVFTPHVDIYEREAAILINADLPGVGEDKIDITLEDDKLTIIGQQCLCQPEDCELLHQGYRPGIFRRSFTLTTPVDRDKINAKVKNGVLTLELPKAEEAKPRKITVQTG